MTNNCTFSEGWLRNFTEPAAEGEIQMEYLLISQAAQVHEQYQKIVSRNIGPYRCLTIHNTWKSSMDAGLKEIYCIS